ncbi:MAG: alpha-2-macroglobulin family protein, partial [Vulcanimicrobiaceae bacterium]
AINPYLLAPNSTYTVTVTPALRDIFGQHFDQPVTQTLHTGNFTPGIWAPTSSAIFPSDFTVGLNIYATNLAGNAYHAAYVPVTEAALIARGPDARSYAPLDGTLATWPSHTISDAKINTQSIVPVPLAKLIGGNTGALGYGIGVHFGSDVDATYSGLVQLTNLGIFTQIFPSSGVVRVTHLSDGSPAAHVAVDVRAVNGDHPNTGAKPLCASGTTNASGAMTLTQIDIERCTALARVSSDAPPLLVIAREGADWSWVDLNSYSGIYAYDVPGGWSTGRPLSRGILYPDRDLYKPGETGELTGVAYLLNNDILAAVPHAAYKVVVTDPDGKTIRTTTVQTDGYGVFSLPLQISPTSRLGYYSVSATGPAGETMYGSFRVAEFRAPNFKLDLSVATPSVIAGATQQATATGSYLFGGALSGAKAVVSVTRDVAMIAPSGYDAYTFGRQWFWPQNSPSFDTNVSQTTGTFDTAGKLSTSVSVPANLDFPMTYTIDVNATDVSNLSVDATQSFTALADADVIGLSGDAVGTAGSPLVMKAVVVSPSGKDVGSRAIHVELQKATYASATQLVGGGESADESVTYATVDSADVQAGAKPTDVTLHPKDAGIYRVRATFAGAKNAAAATDTQVWVSGSSGDFVSQYGDRSVAIKLDRKQYNVGDTATAVVQSPYPHARVTLDVIRNSVLYETSVDATGSAVRIPFTITPSMLPNVAVQARVVRTGRPLSQLAAKDVPSTLMRIGMTALNVKYSGHLLKVAITPTSPQVEPGSKQTLQFSLKSANGKAATGEMVVAVVNEAILQLTGFRPPTLLDAIYAQQPISTRFAQNGERVVTQMEKAPLAKGWGYGGGFLGGAADARIRHTFTPLAYYSARVRTDASGNATTTFAMPDDLTTWRIMVVALDRNGRDVGNGDTTFISTKKLITNPMLPQFARPGDRIDGGLTIRNATQAAANATVSLSTTGSLHFASGDPSQQTATQRVDVGMQALRYAMVVGTPAPTTYTVRSSLGGDNDAFEIPLAIRDRSVTQTSFDAGSTTDLASLTIDTAQKATLVLTLANTAVPQFLVPASDVLKAAKWPFADDTSGRLVIDTMLKRSTAEDLASLAALHRSDGGFAFTPSDITSDPYATATALHALAFAKDHGIAVSAIPVDATLGYARSILADPTRLPYCKSSLCRARTRFEMMTALSAWGEHTTSFLEEILANDAQFDAATRMRLARYLLATPNYVANGKQMAAHYLTQTNLSGRFATLNVADPWSWLGGDSQAQAQLVRLAVADGASHDFLDAALRSLAVTSCHCSWGGVDGTSAALQALAAYQTVSAPHALHIVVQSGATQVGTVDLPATPASKDLAISAASLTTPKLDISVRGGTLHYIATITAQVPRNSPGALAGLRVTRTLTALGAKTPIATFDLNPLTTALSVPAAQVYDIGIR